MATNLSSRKAQLEKHGPRQGTQSSNTAKLSALDQLSDAVHSRIGTVTIVFPLALPFVLPHHGQGCTDGAQGEAADSGQSIRQHQQLRSAALAHTVVTMFSSIH